MIFQVVIPPLPAELIVITAGRSYDIKLVTFFAGSGLFIGSAIVFYIGRYIHTKLARFFNRKKTQIIVARIQKIETLLLWVRILPYNPSDIISYAAGIIEVQTRKYLVITLCTSFIRVFILSFLGSQITNIKSLFHVGTMLLISALIGSAIAYGKSEGINLKQENNHGKN
jgi:uncharacterized membrane protein YdjX (TVP38/TMEM64 family)